MSVPSFSHPCFCGWIGVARRDITPPTGIYSRNWGAAPSDVAEFVHRPMTLTVLTFRETEAGEPVALISMDLCVWRSTAERDALHGAVQRAGVSKGRYMIAFSHTHAGPSTYPGFAGKPGGHLIADYPKSRSWILKLVIPAANRRG